MNEHPNANDFAIGDRVVHSRGTKREAEGVVVALEYEARRCVVVEFSPSPTSRLKRPWRGAYNQQWFDLHPGLLQKATCTRSVAEPPCGDAS